MVFQFFFVSLLANVVCSKAAFQLTIYHNTDMYSHFEETFDYKMDKTIGGISRLGQLLDRARLYGRKRSKNVMYLNAGNNFGGTYLYHIYKWNIVSRMLNVVHPDAVALGGQEFLDGLKGLEPFLEDVDFPIVSANIHAEPGTIFHRIVKPSVILNISNTKVGIIGYTGKDTAGKYPVGNLKFTNELEAVQNECKILKEKNVTVIIALGNANLETDIKIGKEANCVDILVGGDSTLFLWNDDPNKLLEDNPSSTYPMVIENVNGKIVPILEGFSKGRYVGKIDLTFDDGDLINYRGNPRLLDENLSIRSINTALTEYTGTYVSNGTANEVLAEVKVYLSAEKCREEECNFGNMIADAFVHYKASKYKGKYWTDTPIAIFNAGSLRKSLNMTEKGFNLTQEDLATALPFREPLITIVLEGKDLKHTLEVGARYNGETRRGEFLMLSGLRVIYDFHRPPYHRVLSVSCRCGNCKTPSYSPLVYNEHYKIITTVFLANGGDGHTVIRRSSISFILEGITDLMATKNYLLANGRVRPECEDRIVHMQYISASQESNIYVERYHAGVLLSVLYLIYLIN